MAKMSLKNKLALIVIPLLIVALIAAVTIIPKETSTQSQASNLSKKCERSCKDKYTRPDALQRCLNTCTSGANWHLTQTLRPLYCTLASDAIAALGQPENKADYKDVRTNILTALEAQEGSEPAKLKKEVTKFSTSDTQKAYQKYCVEDSEE